MRSWNCIIKEDEKQTSSTLSYIGGKPNLPLSLSIPKCTICGDEMTFMFQIAFPKEHFLNKKTMSVYFCTLKDHDIYCIPEIPPPDVFFDKETDEYIDNIEVTKEFLEQYERNFKILVFDTDNAEIVESYEEKCIFKNIEFEMSEYTNPDIDFVIGGEPIWIMGEDINETPNSICEDTNIGLIMQIREDYIFDKHFDAHIQENEYRVETNEEKLRRIPYMLFASDRIYFWGTKDKENLKVFISVQAP